MGGNTCSCLVVSPYPGLISPPQQVQLPLSQTTSDLKPSLIHLTKSKTHADQAVCAVPTKVKCELLWGDKLVKNFIFSNYRPPFPLISGMKCSSERIP